MNLKVNPLLLCDFYKMIPSHSRQYPKGLTKVVSYFTPRMSRLAGQDKLIMFSLQGFIKDYLIDNFNDNFFNRPREEVVKEYVRVCKYAFLCDFDTEKVGQLHDLGYLPISIRAIPEGERVDIKVPMFEISNTHPEFPWLTNCLETLISCSLWHSMVSANIGYEYRKIVNEFFDKTVDDSFPRRRALGDFAMRGQESLESATRSSAAWLLSFVNTATVPSILWLEKNYNCDMEKEEVGFGALSTEHSVMCSNFAVDGYEITMVKRLLTEIYPNNSFSMVSDSYDYWNMVDTIIPQCKEEIMNHNGTILIRGDSGNAVDIICGEKDIREYNNLEEAKKVDFYNTTYAKVKNKYYKIYHKLDDRISGAYQVCEEFKPTPKDLGTVWILWNKFGGVLNTKNYKLLDSKVKSIYGDAITLTKCRKIYERLEKNGFACNNVALGVGSFSMQCIEESVKGREVVGVGDCGCQACNETYKKDISILKPFTRDTFGIAIKATYAEDKDGNPIMIYKDPKTDDGKFKKSQKGCCVVTKDSLTGTYNYYDELSYSQSCNNGFQQLQEVFKDGKMIKEYSLKEIRDRLHGGNF